MQRDPTIVEDLKDRIVHLSYNKSINVTPST